MERVDSRSGRGLTLVWVSSIAGVLLLIAAAVLASGSAPPAARSSTSLVNAKASGTRLFLAFVRVSGPYQDVGTIWTADLDGSNQRRLAAGNAPDISPDGRWIAFLDRNERLRVVASGGGASRPLDRHLDPWAFRWAPDSRRLAVVSRGSLVVIAIDSGKRVTVDRGRHVIGFSFSPTGEEIAWARKTGKLTPTLGGSDIYRGSTNGGGVRRLTHDRGSYKPMWGPRGIAFARFEPFTLLHPRIELWQVRRDGEGLRRVSGKNLAPFGWSDDGRRLLAYGETEVTAYPFAVDPSSGNARTLIRRSTPDVSTAAISRNGRWVLAWVDGELVQIPWAGGNLRVLVRGVGESADWSR